MNYETSLENPVNITIENKTGIDQAIRYYRVNFQDILKPEDSITVTALTSEELAYYTKLQKLLEESNSENVDLFLKSLNNLIKTLQEDGHFPPHYEIEFVDSGEVTEEKHIGNEVIPSTTYKVNLYNITTEDAPDQIVHTIVSISTDNSIIIVTFEFTNEDVTCKIDENGTILNEYHHNKMV